jgi:hypothetical protein
MYNVIYATDTLKSYIFISTNRSEAFPSIGHITDSRAPGAKVQNWAALQTKGKFVRRGDAKVQWRWCIIVFWKRLHGADNLSHAQAAIATRTHSRGCEESARGHAIRFWKCALAIGRARGATERLSLSFPIRCNLPAQKARQRRSSHSRLLTLETSPHLALTIKHNWVFATVAILFMVQCKRKSHENIIQRRLIHLWTLWRVTEENFSRTFRWISNVLNLNIYSAQTF